MYKYFQYPIFISNIPPFIEKPPHPDRTGVSCRRRNRSRNQLPLLSRQRYQSVDAELDGHGTHQHTDRLPERIQRTRLQHQQRLQGRNGELFACLHQLGHHEHRLRAHQTVFTRTTHQAVNE